MSLNRALHDANRAIGKAALPLTSAEQVSFFDHLIQTLTDLAETAAKAAVPPCRRM